MTMIPYAKLRARRRVRRSTSAYAASTVIQSSDGREREAHARRARTLGEDVPARMLERFERRQAAAREQADGTADSSTDPPLQDGALRQQSPSASRFEFEQRAQLGARTVDARDAEQAPIVGRQIDAAEREIARHVLQEVHQLQACADVVARRHELGTVGEAKQAENEP